METIPPAVQALLDVFANHLADVKFPDVDATTLARAADEVTRAGDSVAAAELALEAARGVLGERQESLMQQAQRAISYARVYAENDEALGTRLETIALPRPARRGKPSAAVQGPAPSSLELASTPRPRGRPRKTRGVEPEPMLLEGMGAHAE